VNRLVTIAAGSALVAFSAAAQDLTQDKLKMEAEQSMVHMKTMGAIRGTTVKGAPYSADEVNETNQVLADGTRIHREIKTSVFRDSEGRMRRETPENITITDPVANVTYILNPKTMTGQKLQMATGNFTFLRNSGPGAALTSTPATFTVTSDNDGPVSVIVNGEKLDEKAMAEAMAKAKESGHTVTYERRITTTDGPGSIAVVAGGASVGGMVMAASARRRVAGEPLGKQMIEGVSAEGTRHITTIDAGAIGNDRPISVTSESWYSEDLQMQVMSKRTDPRTGDETFRMTNIRRGEPGGYLFQPPAGYQINERK
jgi:hypothetical protein